MDKPSNPIWISGEINLPAGHDPACSQIIVTKENKVHKHNKKYKILKDILGRKTGEICYRKEFFNNYTDTGFENLKLGRYIEEIEEKITLLDKLKFSYPGIHKDIYKIVKEHYLKAFDTALVAVPLHRHVHILYKIRKALEDA